jgi:hypothetical protein
MWENLTSNSKKIFSKLVNIIDKKHNFIALYKIFNVFLITLFFYFIIIRFQYI